MTQAKRWSPGRGFTKLQDYGSVAVWMKPQHDGALLAAYLPGYDAAGNEHFEKWIIELPRGADFHWDILDKYRRIRWLLDTEKPELGSTLWGVKILKYEQSGPSHKKLQRQPVRRVWASWHRGHKHFWTGKRIRPWEGEWGIERIGKLPRKIEAALKPGFEELKAIQAYWENLWARWTEEVEVLEERLNTEERVESHDHED